MRLSLPLRIVLVHLIFSLGAAAAAVVLVRASFQAYRQQWASELVTIPPEAVFQPLAHEVARSLLLRLENQVPESREAIQQKISDGLHAILKGLPSIEGVWIVDQQGRIVFAPDTSQIDLGFTGDRRAQYLNAQAVTRQRIELPDKSFLTEAVVPIFADSSVPAHARRRLGTLVVRYLPDEALAARVPSLQPPSVDYRDFSFPLTIFLAAVGVGAVLISALSLLPVRRLDRALSALKARDFRGGLQLGPHAVVDELRGTVAAINELSGRFEALDARWREREALLGTLSRSLEEGMVAADAEGQPVTWNAAALRILTPAALRDEAEGSRPSFSEEAELREAVRRNPQLLLRDPASGAGGTQEMEVTRDDGSRLPAQVTRVPFEVRPKVMGTLLLVRDLATLRKVEGHLLEAGRYAVLAHLAAGLAHEIRNPLHAIGLNAGAVQEHINWDRSSPRYQAMSESLRTIQEETRRLTELLNNYLGLVRPSSTPGPVDLRDLCGRVIRLLEYTARVAKVELLLEGDDALPEILGERDRLQQAILNLVLNAIQAMPAGGIVRVRTSHDAGLVRVTVLDTGPGLPVEVQEHLFDVRVTTKAGGTGLGLPLVRLIAEAHGGSIWYRSTPGEGAAFTLVLPAREGRGQALPFSVSAARAEKENGST